MLCVCSSSDFHSCTHLFSFSSSSSSPLFLLLLLLSPSFSSSPLFLFPSSSFSPCYPLFSPSLGTGVGSTGHWCLPVPRLVVEGPTWKVLLQVTSPLLSSFLFFLPILPSLPSLIFPSLSSPPPLLPSPSFSSLILPSFGEKINNIYIRIQPQTLWILLGALDKLI